MKKKKNNDRINYLFKNTAIFALGSIATKFINFFLVPLYVKVLSKEEYGTVDLIHSLNTVLSILLIFNIYEGIIRFSLDKDADNNKIISIGFVVYTISIFFCVLLFPVLKSYAPLAPYVNYIFFYTITSIGSLIFLSNLKGKEKLVEFSIGNIIHTFAIALFNIIYLLVLKKSIKGYFTAYIIANTITIFYSFIVGNCYKNIVNFVFDRLLFKDIMKYSLVLMPNTLIWWIINSADRIMITSILGIAANGIYAVSYKLPTILSTISEIFNKSWMFSAIHENESADVEEYSNSIYKYLFAFVSTIAIAVMVIMKPFMMIYVDNIYYDAWKYIPYLIVGFVFLTLSSFFSNTYIANKDSTSFLFSSVFGAIVNILLNAFLIPIIKIHGAALSTCISYAVIFIYRAISTKKYIVIRTFSRKCMCGFALLILTAITSYTKFCISEVLMTIELILGIGLFYSEWNIFIKSIFNKLKKNKIKILK